MMTTLAMARAAKSAALEQFSRLARVVGVGITRVDDEYAVKVNVTEIRPGIKLPTQVGGVPVRVEVTGEIKPRT